MKRFCLVLAVLFSIALPASGSHAAPPVKFGYDDVRSGPFKNNGDMALIGMETAIKEINRNRGSPWAPDRAGHRGQPDEP